MALGRAGQHLSAPARYFAVLEKEPTSSWSVYAPDIPGCVAAADTPDEALANAALALKEVVEDVTADERAAPKARTIEELNADPEVHEILAGGAALVAVPLLLDKGRIVRANLTVDAGSLEVIDDAAAERGVSRSAFMVAAALEKAVG
jgi:predicted RNase H-like HicB family nuclease